MIRRPIRIGRRNKFNVAPKAERTVDGIVFASKREMVRYGHMKLWVEDTRGRWFLRQVPFYLRGGAKYVCDFLAFDPAGLDDDGEPLYRIRVLDAKGFKTAVYKLKKRMVESEYPVRIEEV